MSIKVLTAACLLSLATTSAFAKKGRINEVFRDNTGISTPNWIPQPTIPTRYEQPDAFSDPDSPERPIGTEIEIADDGQVFHVKRFASGRVDKARIAWAKKQLLDENGLQGHFWVHQGVRKAAFWLTDDGKLFLGTQFGHMVQPSWDPTSQTIYFQFGNLRTVANAQIQQQYRAQQAQAQNQQFIQQHPGEAIAAAVLQGLAQRAQKQRSSRQN